MLRSPSSTARFTATAPHPTGVAAPAVRLRRRTRQPGTSLPPGPREPFVLGVVRMLREGEGRFDVLRRRYGDMFSLRVPSLGNVVALTDPELAKQVLTADPAVLEAGEGNLPLGVVVGGNSLLLLDGAEHLAMRKLLLPQLHGGELERQGESIARLTEEMIERWPLNRPLAAWPQMQELTLEVIMRVVFGIQEESRLTALRPTLRRLLSMVRSRGMYVRYALRDLGGMRRWAGFQRTLADAHRLLDEEIAARRADPELERRGDLLALLLRARDEHGEGLGDAALRDQLMTLLVAGHETTATGLAWALERLTRHPDALRRLTEEAIGGEGDAYANAVALETLRTRPPVPIVARRLSQPYALAGYRLPRGTRIVPLIIAIHRRADLYPDPLAFRPERFLDTRPSTYTWLAFGGGIRRCIGASFAMLEMRTVLQTMARTVRFAANAERRDEPPDVRAIFYTPRYGARVTIERRRPLLRRFPRQIGPPKQYPLLPEGSPNPPEESAMEAGTTEQPGTGSTVERAPSAPTPSASAPTGTVAGQPSGNTIADLLPHAVAAYADSVAIRHKHDGAWLDVTYAQLSAIVDEIAMGLIDLGIQPGDRVCILAGTRPEWTYADLAITAVAAVVVPIYPTNSPEECHWVIADSGATAIVCENADQLAKVAVVRDRLPQLRETIAIDVSTQSSPAGQPAGPDEAPLQPISLAELRERGKARAAREGMQELERRRTALTPEDPYTFIYTSGTTGPPKGCVLSHGNYCAVVDMVREVGQIRENEVAYLFLPLAHALALLIQLGAIDRGTTIAYFGGDVKQIVGELQEVKPTFLPSVPRIFEKIYTLAHGAIEAQPPEERAKTEAALKLGAKVRDMLAREEAIPEELRAPFEEAEDGLFKNVRAIFGGNLHQAATGAAPIAHEILEFFWACGVPVLEGYGMTETSTIATISTIEDHRFGTVGRALPGVQLRIADDGEILVKGANIFQGYHHNADASFGAVEDGWLHTGDLGSLDDDGYLSITGRKKDIIITAGGKNLTPANIENDLKQCRWISQAVMHGDRRPYPVVLITLDEEEIGAYAREHSLPDNPTQLAREPAIHELIEAEVQRVNANYAQVEQVKKFAILPRDLSQEGGELTPTLKVKRNIVEEKYVDILDSLYAGG
ncbi:MAG TPA: cytochrome P450 [Solirubrobacteraceae bacterium]|nr:cytochrome P450 [Solirubrobacteraceae bacterium]